MVSSIRRDNNLKQIIQYLPGDTPELMSKDLIYRLLMIIVEVLRDDKIARISCHEVGR